MLDIKTQVSPTQMQTHKRTSINIIMMLLVAVALAMLANMIIGPTLKNDLRTTGLSGLPVNGGYADPLLKQSVWQTLVSFQKAAGCGDVTSISISVQQEPSPQGVWIENWAVNQCNAMQTYRIRFAPDPSGGTAFAIGK